MPDQIVDRVYHEILPRINDRITNLTLEPHTMERVLRSLMDCPSLSSLRLVNFLRKTIVQHLTGKITVAMNIDENVFPL